MIKGPLIIALLFRSLDAIRVFDLFYVFGQRAVPSMASYSDFKMFAGSPLDFAPGVAAAIIIFIFGLVISLVLLSMMRERSSQR
jgi:ABC-type sugar transport system permease subunit